MCAMTCGLEAACLHERMIPACVSCLVFADVSTRAAHATKVRPFKARQLCGQNLSRFHARSVASPSGDESLVAKEYFNCDGSCLSIMSCVCSGG
jgi:hypothetical protein